jgi:hypothetical protein
MLLITEASLSALFAQSFFYGISTMSFIACVRVLVGNASTYPSSATIRYGLFMVATTMFVVSDTYRYRCNHSGR